MSDSRSLAAAERITRSIELAVTGDRIAAEEVLSLTYDELRKLAGARLAKLPPGQTLQATALVHEAYLRVAGKESEGWCGRRHFFFAAARAMRDILVESIRRKTSLKRGGDRQRIELGDLAIAFDRPVEELLSLDDAMKKLELAEPRTHEIILLRFYSGLDVEEIGELLDISTSTVKRKCRYASAWLRREVDGELGESSDAP